MEPTLVTHLRTTYFVGDLVRTLQVITKTPNLHQVVISFSQVLVPSFLRVDFVRKQVGISRSSTEAELVILDIGFLQEAVPALVLWEKIIESFHPDLAAKAQLDAIPGIRPRHQDPIKDTLLGVDWVPQIDPKYKFCIFQF